MSKFSLLALVLAGGSLVFPKHSHAATFQEDFSTDPAAHGWKTVGESSLFQWNPAHHCEQITWDSSRSNSYFALPLGTVLGKEDNFSLAFDLRLSDFVAGVNPDKPNPFQLAVAFINLDEASQPGFVRGTGADSPDLTEFSFFPDPGGAWIYGPSLTTEMVDSIGTDPGADWAYGFAGLSLTTDDLFRITMAYTATNQTLHTQITRNTNEVFATFDAVISNTNFTDFRLNAVAVCSYSDAGQDPQYSGSILAHGIVDNVLVTVPPLPVTSITGNFSNSVWQVSFLSRSNWVYTLERTPDFQTWLPLAPAANGNGTNLILQDTHAPSAKAFYRVKAQRP
ncbi:MAG: hypothetical protein QOJ40_2919 [Verrucomicrobiota bacterium]